MDKNKRARGDSDETRSSHLQNVFEPSDQPLHRPSSSIAQGTDSVTLNALDSLWGRKLKCWDKNENKRRKSKGKCTKKVRKKVSKKDRKTEM